MVSKLGWISEAASWFEGVDEDVDEDDRDEARDCALEGMGVS